MVRQEKVLALGELLGGLLHDLNTPLGTLKANAQLMESLAAKLAASHDDQKRERLRATLTATGDAIRSALDQIDALRASLSESTTLEGAALRELEASFTSGVTQAIVARHRG